jgi:hypothetical protein
VQFLALLIVAGVVFSLTVVFAVFGASTSRLFRWQWISRQGPGLNAVVGLAASLLFLEVWNFFYPINHASVAVLGALVLASVLLAWRTGVGVIQEWFRSSSVWLAYSLLVLLFTVSWFGLGPHEHDHYDTGLYYLNAIRWAREYPVVPGLANLHTRLGYNQSLFLFVAFLANVMNLGVGRACQVVNPIFVFVCGWAILDRLKLDLTIPKTTRVKLYVILLLCPLFFLATHMWISAPTSDIAAAAFALPGALAAFYCLEEILDRNAAEARNWFLLLTVVGATLTKLKLSYAVLAGSAITVVAIAFIFIEKRELLRLWIRAAILAVALVIPWAARGVVESGYPFFPSTLIRFHTDWAVPRKLADLDRDWVYSWAKSPKKPPREVLVNDAWFGSWVERNAQEPENIFLFFFVMAGLISALLSLAIPPGREQRLQTVLLMLPPALALIFWFKTAPEPRFGYAIFLLFGVNGFYAASAVISGFSNIGAGIYTCLITSVCLRVLFVSQWPIISFYEKKFPQGFPKAELEYQTTHSGLRVGVPKGEKAWNSGLIVTPYCNPNLTMRGPELRDGFRMQRANRQRKASGH